MMIRRPLYRMFLISAMLLFTTTSCFDGRSSIGNFSRPVVIPRNIPAYISTISLEVTAEDMETISVEDIDQAEGSITFEVPAGEARTFSLVMDTGSVVFEGSATEDLVAGEGTEIVVEMEMTDSRILIPDASFYNYGQSESPWYGRLVQIDDITGTGWIAKDGTDFGYANDELFMPVDMDFDEYGRIYIVNRNQNNGGGGQRSGSIIRIDSILDSTPETLITGSNPLYRELGFVTIDRINHKMYYCLYNSGTGEWDLMRSDYDGNNPEVVITVSGSEIRDAEIGTNVIYVLWNPEVITIGSYTYSGVWENSGGVNLNDSAFDLFFRDPYLYVANWDDIGSNNTVLQYDSDINYIKALDQEPGGTEQFIGPHRLIATIRRKFYLIDEIENDGAFYNDLENLFAFDDIDGTNWQSFQPTDIGENLFHFYAPC